jgi:hypothetical protein
MGCTILRRATSRYSLSAMCQILSCKPRSFRMKISAFSDRAVSSNSKYEVSSSRRALYTEGELQPAQGFRIAIFERIRTFAAGETRRLEPVRVEPSRLHRIVRLLAT